jgi:hypothetical protein
MQSLLFGRFPHARCIADSSTSLDCAIGARYHLSGRQDSPLIVIRQQGHPAQEEVQYEAEVSAPVHSRKAICATASGFSHNVECRIMLHAFWPESDYLQFCGYGPDLIRHSPARWTFRRNDCNWASGLNRPIEALARNTNQRLLDVRIGLP